MVYKKIDIRERTYQFSLKIIQLSASIPYNRIGNILADQVLRSGTSIGANVEEADGSLTKKEFTHTMNIAQKEAKETHYWLRLSTDSGLLSKTNSMLGECYEIIKILSAIVRSSKKKKNKN